jgi:hypothetical protein
MTYAGLARQDLARRLRRHHPEHLHDVATTLLRDPRLHHQRGSRNAKQWTLEMHYPSDGKDSLITTDNFDDFAEVERKMK